MEDAMLLVSVSGAVAHAAVPREALGQKTFHEKGMVTFRQTGEGTSAT